MSKMIDLNKNVAELCSEFPELKEVMMELGFKDIKNPLILNTMGKMITIPKGARMKSIPMSSILEALDKKGFQVIHVPEGEQDETAFEHKQEHENEEQQNKEQQNKEQQDKKQLTEKEILLKNYIQRLTDGENLELVKEEFIQNFSDVSAIEIARAEQSLLKDGTPLSDVQRLCDVHSSLFHGVTSAERIANAEKEVERSAKEEELNQISKGFEENVSKKTQEFMRMKGHPLYVLTLENNAIVTLLDEIEKEYVHKNDIESILAQLKKMTTIAQHYGKKDELMFPLLKDVYGYPGPSDVMWGVEDEIRASLRQVIAEPENEKAEELLNEALKRIREMIYKEENILFPLAVENFTEDDWIAIARDMPMFGPCLIDEIPTWEKIGGKKQNVQVDNGKVTLPGGSMTISQLRAMLNTLPLEITLVDENDINSFFNEGEKLLTRPTMAIGRKVYSCHPKRVEPMVRLLIHEFKTRKRDSMHLIAEKAGKKVLINYYALRDEAGNYLGTLEAVQQLDSIAEALQSGKKGPIKI